MTVSTLSPGATLFSTGFTASAGTIQTAITKATRSPTVPATTPNIESDTEGRRVEGALDEALLKEIGEALANGGSITAIKIFYNFEQGTAKKVSCYVQRNLEAIGALVEVTGTGQKWAEVSANEVGLAKIKTQANVEELRFMLSKASGGKIKVFDVYAEITWTSGHAHTLTIAQPQTTSLRAERTGIFPLIVQPKVTSRVTSPARRLALTQPQVVSRTTAPSKSLLIAQAQAASRGATSIARSLTLTQEQVVSRLTALARTLALTQAQSVVRVASPSRIFPTISQHQSYAKQMPELPISDTLEREEEPPAGWAALAWQETLGSLQKRSTKKGWGASELKSAGGRYEASSFTDPVNVIDVRAPETLGAGENRYVAVGCCVPAAEHSGYFARFTFTAGKEWKLELERWVAGAKTVLAETTLPVGFFENGTPGTLIGITAIAGVVRVWTTPAGTINWSQAVEAADTTFSSGYDAVEFRGTKWFLTSFRGGSMDSQVSMMRGLAFKQTLTTTAATSAATLSKSVGRNLAVAQPQTATRGATSLSKTLAIAQTQVVSRLVSLARLLTTTGQAQAPSVSKTPGKTLTTTGQAQAVSKLVTVSRALSVAQTQAASRSTSLTRALNVTQVQSSSVARLVSKQLSVTQGQSVSRLASVARALSVAASQVVKRITNPARTLTIPQSQEVEMTGPSEHTNTKITLTCSGEQTATLRHGAVARTLRASNPQTPSFSRAVARTLAVSQTQVASRGATSITRTLTVSGGQNCTLSEGSKAKEHTLTPTAASQTLKLRRQIAHTFRASGAQTATVEGHVIETPTLPPARMTSTVKTSLNMKSGVSHP